MKLIDKDALVAEIKKHQAIWDGMDDDYCKGQRLAYSDVISFLDTLEVKEVDLDKELDYDDYIKFFNEHPNYNNGDWGFEETWEFGQYFYELGLKAQKGE